MLVRTINLRFSELVASVADSLIWPLQEGQPEQRTVEEPVRRKHLKKESDTYLIIEGPRLDNAATMMDLGVARNDLLLQRCTWVGGLVTRRAPEPGLIASPDDELGSVVRGFAGLELEVREAA